MRLLLSPLSLLLLFACKSGSNELTLTSVFATLPELPTASDAEQITESQSHIIETQLTDEGWRIHGQPVTTEKAELEDQIKKLKEQIQATGFQPYLLIEASSTTVMSQIRLIIRTSARAGIDNILFATKQNKTASDRVQYALSLALPCACPFDYQAFKTIIIHADQDNALTVNTDPMQKNKSAFTPVSLPQFKRQLAEFQLLTKVQNKKVLLTFGLHKETSYQCMIDVINLMHSQNNQWITFVDLESDDKSSGPPCVISQPDTPRFRSRLPVAPKFKPPIIE